MKKFGRKTTLNLRYGSDKGSHSVVSDWKGCDFMEIAEKKTTNADRIRNMSDEELAELIIGSLNFDCADYCDSFAQGCAFNCGKKKDREIALKWLQSEAEWGSIKNE